MRFLQILKSGSVDMLNRKLARIALFSLISPVLLQGCAQMPGRTVSAIDNMAVSTAQKAPELNGLSQGDLVELDSGLLAPFGKVTIGRKYYAASGRLCKQILNVAGEEVVSIVCSVDAEHWYVRKPLGGKSKKVSRNLSPLLPTLQETPKPQAGWSEQRSVLATGQDSSDVVQENETLWSFSKRTTGSALNWKAIAKYNNIDDAHIVNSGDALFIPALILSTEK